MYQDDGKVTLKDAGKPDAGKLDAEYLDAGKLDAGKLDAVYLDGAVCPDGEVLMYIDAFTDDVIVPYNPSN